MIDTKKVSCQSPSWVPYAIVVICGILKNAVKRAFNAENAAAGNAGVAFGGADIGMAKEFLNVADVSAAFKKVGRKGMTEAVNRNGFFDFGAANGFVENMLGGTNC